MEPGKQELSLLKPTFHPVSSRYFITAVREKYTEVVRRDISSPRALLEGSVTQDFNFNPNIRDWKTLRIFHEKETK